MRKIKKIGVIGRGKWGKKIIKVLRHHSSIKYIIGRNFNYKKCSTDLDWVFVLTPNKTHYKICEFFLKKGVNVFCEKPLTLSLNEANHLYKLAAKNKVILYVDDVEIYKEKKIKIFNKNLIIRMKKDKGSSYSLIDRLFYHDAYLLFDYIKKFNIKKIKILNKSKLNFQINFEKISVNFMYSLKSSKKIHKINNINFLSFKGNPLEKMIFHVLNKLKNYSKNKERSLFALKTTQMLKKNIIKNK